MRMRMRMSMRRESPGPAAGHPVPAVLHRLGEGLHEVTGGGAEPRRLPPVPVYRGHNHHQHY